MISPDTIREVRERTDILAIIGESVPTLKRRGRSFSGLCPFHNEKSPSFHVNPDRGFYHCFGCKESGSVIDFVMKQDGYTFPEAVRMLAERLGIEVAEDRLDIREIDRQKKQRDDLYAVNNLAAFYFETQLREHSQRQYALDELARRQLSPSDDYARGFAPTGPDATAANSLEGAVHRDDAPPPAPLVDEALRAFRVGYAPLGWDGLTTFLREQGISLAVAEAVGLLVPRSSGTGYYDRFRHRLMFAVIDPQGRVIAFSGRALLDPPGTPPRDDKPAKYINSPESPIYQKGNALFGLHQAKSAIRREQSAILVEGNFDVVSLHARGLKNVVAPLGTAFTTEQAALLKRFAPNIVFLFDADLAGRKAVVLARESCRKVEVSARVATLPEGKDPDELVRARGESAIKACVAGARGMLEYLLDTALDQTFVAADAYERANRVEQVARLLAEENDPLVRSMAKAYADQLAGRTDVVRVAPSSDAFQALERSVKKALANAPPPRGGPPQGGGVGADPRRARIAPQPPERPLRASMVGDIIEFPELLAQSDVQDGLRYLEGPAAQTIAAIANSIRIGPSGAKTLDTSVFLAQIPSAIQEFAAKRLAVPLHDSADAARRNFLDKAALLRKLILSRETEEISRSQQMVQGDWQAEVGLAREAYDRTRQKHGLAHLPAPPTKIPTQYDDPRNDEPE